MSRSTAALTRNPLGVPGLRLDWPCGSLAPLAAAALALAQLLAVAPAFAQGRALEDSSFDCLVDAPARVKLSAAVPGLIEAIHVERGDRVKKGQLLVELESNVERAQLAIARSRARNDQPVKAAQARVKFTAQAADRIIRLKQTNPGAVTALQFDEVTSQADIAAFNLREAELNLEAAALDVERALAVLDQKRVVSPIDGIVVERTMEAGEYRNEQSSILTLAQIDPLQVEVFIPVAYYGATPPGRHAEVTFDAPLASRHQATVTVADQILDTGSGTFAVRLTLPNPDLAIPAGLRCRLRFQKD
ncbi:efflux RND transporter periplasmic adaptor subunit [Ancylobacter sp. SL191]|uniref:efflux RND transporter periplasmic adaptor subunit n=1 Tax=Ancylobacter sp. SL191 TaxID=2995166 RepID=UPI0022706D55|nr:efflux RND transporter periplasmic adaptor subunit [Ancylobacter sp. SL191]WAC26072.1 efflux RND transporter periplasmic adaptor subunit [Ancylobacter sp. SL191]